MATTKTRNKRKGRNRSVKATKWLKQAGWLVKTMLDIHETPSAHGTKWQKNMLAHYNKQFKALQLQRPVSCRTESIAFQAQVDDIIASYRNL